MTNEKARDLLSMIEVKEPNELIVNSWWGSFVKDYKEALQMAIKSLEAWELVKQEIDEASEIHSDGEFYIKNFDVKRIIGRHLVEVRE